MENSIDELIETYFQVLQALRDKFEIRTDDLFFSKTKYPEIYTILHNLCPYCTR